jgi:cytochrome c peroxidase
MKKFFVVFYVTLFLLIIGCSKNDISVVPTTTTTGTNTLPVSTLYAAIKATFGTEIDPLNLANYANQGKPSYITKDNTGNNSITNAKATLGRVLFYDKNLSVDNSVSCASCHKQEFAFSDTALVSNGVLGGQTARHSIRLINARFGEESKFFWDERALTLESQTTQPMVSHVEMGFSGQSGRGDINTLLSKLQGINYYNELFKFVYGDVNVTETRLQECLAQFVRSIQSFDSKYDAGRATAQNESVDFSNFTAQENLGKSLFMTLPTFDANSSRISGGLGCNKCHRAPEFDIDPTTKNNGVIALAVGSGQDFTVTRAPSLRDILNSSGVLNGRLMHSGGIRDIATAVSHYGGFINDNPNLDPRLKPNGKNIQRLNLQQTEIAAVTAFMKTLTGVNVYTDKRWSSPFK